jgi:hypothetical protein
VKVRAFDSLAEKLSELLPVSSPSMLQINNVFIDNPGAADAFLDARCPECDAIRKYGVAHACDVVDANLIPTKAGVNAP